MPVSFILAAAFAGGFLATAFGYTLARWLGWLE